MRIQHLIFIFILILAACGGDEAPPESAASEESDVQTSDAEATEDPNATLSFDELAADVLEENPQQPVVFPTVTQESEGALPIPLPGTLVASETEDPEADGLDFDELTFLQIGGVNDIEIRFKIYGDGRLERDDQVTQIDIASIDQLNQFIDDLNFMGLQGTLSGSTPDGDTYRYRITVVKGDVSRSIWSQDGFMPAEYRNFIGLIRFIGDSVAS